MKKGVDKYDEEMCRVWKDDLDTMLVFVRSYSGVNAVGKTESRYRRVFFLL